MTFEHDFKKLDGTKPKVSSLQQFIIWRFFKTPELLDKRGWPRELKIASKILKTYNRQDFWLQYDLGFKLNSLAFFLTGSGKNQLFLDYNRFLIDFAPKIEYDLGDKQGEDRFFPKKQTLRDFVTK